MKISEIRELSTPDLMERIDTERTMLIRMKLNHAITPLDDTQKIREVKLTIARLLTELRSRELSNKSNSQVSNGKES
ncbi:MAG TPA: 50S ribosomal protein L29 [Bacteroidales bacterium]|nr:50S ribosomal protein L29 [Bacteroidales bacterium]